jgi:quercetin dioxygenase-like cupin family protein
MSEPKSSCEIHSPLPSETPRSQVVRFQAEKFRWQNVPVADYKESADHWQGVSRLPLLGNRGEKSAFQVRYFEIAPGGFSSREHHAHEHCVIILRGRGQAVLGETTHEVGFGDMVYVAADEIHQFRNQSASEPFGFLCIVDADRDRPVIVGDGERS